MYTHILDSGTEKEGKRRSRTIRIKSWVGVKGLSGQRRVQGMEAHRRAESDGPQEVWLGVAMRVANRSEQGTRGSAVHASEWTAGAAPLLNRPNS